MYAHTPIHTQTYSKNKVVKENALGGVQLIKSGNGSRDGMLKESNG